MAENSAESGGEGVAAGRGLLTRDDHAKGGWGGGRRCGDHRPPKARATAPAQGGSRPTPRAHRLVGRWRCGGRGGVRLGWAVRVTTGRPHPVLSPPGSVGRSRGAFPCHPPPATAARNGGTRRSRRDRPRDGTRVAGRGGGEGGVGWGTAGARLAPARLHRRALRARRHHRVPPRPLPVVRLPGGVGNPLPAPPASAVASPAACQQDTPRGGHPLPHPPPRSACKRGLVGSGVEKERGPQPGRGRGGGNTSPKKDHGGPG